MRDKKKNLLRYFIKQVHSMFSITADEDSENVFTTLKNEVFH